MGASCLLGQAPSRDAGTDVACEFVDNVVYLPVTINGHGGLFMTLDTGTNPSAIDVAKAKMLGLPLSAPAGDAKGFGTGTVTTQRTTVDRLNVSGIEARQVEFDALDLSAKTAAAAKPIIGLVGYSFLGDRTIQIDYPHKRLRVYAQPPAAPPNAMVLPLELDHGVPVIDVELAGQKSHALVDTGGSYKLLVTPFEAKKLGLEKELIAAKPIGGSGYSGEQQVRLGTASRLTVGLRSR
ncbi:MAG: aspartyl protease family protein [Verrucomicrobia bacterium]|nr:aspartyl protease family protein [Verrucomicrobiota bacterium]